jgi:hypothetical protein
VRYSTYTLIICNNLENYISHEFVHDIYIICNKLYIHEFDDICFSMVDFGA